MTAALSDWKQPFREAAPTSDFPIHTVLVPLDGSAVAKVALPVARSLAQLAGATLHALYVGERLKGPRETLEQLGLTAEQWRGAVLDQLGGDPAEAIMAAAHRLPAPLIVTCTHIGRHRFGASLGSVTRTLLAKCPGRILLVPPDRGSEAWPIRRVLMAHDGTPSADVAICPAANLAHRAGAEVIALHIAARKGVRPTEPGSLPAPLYVDQPHHEWPAWAGEFVERMMALGHHPGAVNFKLLVTGGQPGSEVAQFARDNHADLVVVPWHGRWESQRPGAVKTIVRRSGCPVLLICAQQNVTVLEPVPEG
jgi:nucleotide-binding universal stress UspA family protein